MRITIELRPVRRRTVALIVGLVLLAAPAIVVASHQFGDVPNSNPFHADIAAIADAGVTSGCGGGNYCPVRNVTRAEMAAFMNRLGALGPGKTPVVNADKVDGLHASAFAPASHNHDGRYYRKNQTNDLLFDQRPIVGSILGNNGARRDNGPYTSSRSATGVYVATYQTTGLGIAESQMPPNVTAAASWFCAAGVSAQADWNAYAVIGGEVTSFSIQIRTFNAAGAAVDCSTQFQIAFAPASSLAIPAPATAGPAAFPPDTTVECRNEPEGAVCEPVD